MRLSRAQEAELERIALERGATPRAAPVRIRIPVDHGKTAKNIEETKETRKNIPKYTQSVDHGPRQSIWIPGWFPVLVNDLRATPMRHWSGPYKRLKADKAIVAAYFAGSGVAKATGPRRVSMMFIMGKGKRLFDRDAPRKSIYDALKQCGAIVDDSPKWLQDGPVSYARALLECTAGSLILLEDL